MNARNVKHLSIAAAALLAAGAAAAMISGRFDPPPRAAPAERPRSLMLENYRANTRACLADGTIALIEIGQGDADAIAA